jgi:hypothetical protein
VKIAEFFGCAQNCANSDWPAPKSYLNGNRVPLSCHHAIDCEWLGRVPIDIGSDCTIFALSDRTISVDPDWDSPFKSSALFERHLIHSRHNEE